MAMGARNWANVRPIQVQRCVQRGKTRSNQLPTPIKMGLREGWARAFSLRFERKGGFDWNAGRRKRPVAGTLAINARHPSRLRKLRALGRQRFMLVFRSSRYLLGFAWPQKRSPDRRKHTPFWSQLSSLWMRLPQAKRISSSKQRARCMYEI